MKSILFTGGRAPVTLELVRLFHHAGHRVYVADSLQPNLAGSSIYCEKSIPVPPPAQQTTAFIQALIHAVQTYNIQLIIPTCEEVYYIAQGLEILELYCNVFTSNIDTLTRLHSKYQFIQKLHHLGLPHPQTLLLDSRKALEHAIRKSENYVLKPEFSRFSSQVILSHENPQGWKTIDISPSKCWVLQQYLEGPQFCSYSVARQGQVLAHSIYPIIYTAGRGATVWFQSVQIPAIDEIVFRIVKDLNYTGQIALDIIQENETFYPIECNPRATSGVHLFTKEDHLPRSFEAEFQGYIQPQPGHSRALKLAMLLYCLPQVRSLSELKYFMKQFTAAKDVILESSDHKPYWVQFQSLWHYFLQARKQKITLIQASTQDIEWNGST